MHLEQRLDFIDSLPSLPPIMMPRAFGGFSEDTPPHDVSKSTASVMPDTINAYLPGVSQQTIDDVNLCKLVMQRAATIKYPEEKQLFEWYKDYVDGLSNLGWTIQNKNIQEVTIRRTGLTMDQVALEVSRGLIGAAGASILANVGKQAVEAVQSSPRAIDIFNSGSKLGTQAKFDIAPVWVDGNGQANMILNCISLDARESSRGILFWKSTRQSTSIKTGAVRCYLDNNVFSGLRARLLSRYSEAGKKFIDDLPDF
ncbi:hypothetical protein IMF27_12405 [Pseudomonas sp. PCH199]|uniref:hypothetical protein n=1 Tax=unclassified Pseudomonas TaxID=196821 RepID=UPI000BD55499|nr:MULTISPECIES: hypothetical protein [unclassified Pseudomonas]MCW8276382.1 hypothetical protein [Pseudomonas sp. PCH199]PAM83179.1 hypothetical protein CES87_12690 [Pseudomonas sp. ERMR1:02]